MIRLLPLALLAAAVFPARAPSQTSYDRLALETLPPGYPVARLDPREAYIQIVTRDGRLALLLSDEGLTMQLTDRALREMEREVAATAAASGGEFTDVLSAAVRGTTFESLRSGYQVPLSEIRSIRYNDGRLVITDARGREIFGEVRSQGAPAMEAFVPDYARRFAREFNFLKIHAS